MKNTYTYEIQRQNTDGTWECIAEFPHRTEAQIELAWCKDFFREQKHRLVERSDDGREKVLL